MGKKKKPKDLPTFEFPILQKMGRTRSGGPRFCADRSGAKTARGPGDLGFAPTGVERRPWTRGFKGLFATIRKTISFEMVFLIQLQKMGLEPTRVLPH